MKKLIALTLMVACLACFSLGCKEKQDTKPAPTPPATQPDDGTTGTGDADAKTE